MVAATTYTPEQKEIADAVSGEALNVAHEVAKEELRPIVRAAITDDTLRAIDKLVGLTGRMIDALEEDLDADDMVIRQRAYTLGLKYTVGHQAIVRPDSDTAGQQLVVQFNLPRPGGAGETQEQEAAVELEATEVRTCDTCA